MNTGDIIPTDRRTRGGLRVGIRACEDGLGERLFAVVALYPTGAADIDMPSESVGLMRPPKGRPCFRHFPDARRAIEANFQRLEA